MTLVNHDGDLARRKEPLESEPPSERRLSSEVIQGLYEAHRRELLAFLIGVLKDENAAQDVCQIVFRRLIEVGHTAREPTIKGWMFQVAMREALDFRRKTARRERHLIEYTTAHGTVIHASNLDDDLVRSEEITRLRILLAQLPADQQQIVRQRIYENKTFAAIAGEMNVPLGTVLTRMRLALDKLRKWFGST